MSRVVLLLALGLVGLAGCAPPPQIDGQITFDGQPVPEGYIAFIPEAGAGTGSGSNILSGNYQLRVPKGKYRVEITASKLMPLPPGQKGMDGATEEVRQYIPERYNTRTELKADVTAPAKVNFDLKP